MTELLRIHGRTARADARDELTAHNVEAVDLVDRARIHVRSIEWASRDIPAIHRHAVKLLVLLDGYQRRHLPDDEPAEAIAA